MRIRMFGFSYLACVNGAIARARLFPRGTSIGAWRSGTYMWLHGNRRMFKAFLTVRKSGKSER